MALTSLSFLVVFLVGKVMPVLLNLNSLFESSSLFLYNEKVLKLHASFLPSLFLPLNKQNAVRSAKIEASLPRLKNETFQYKYRSEQKGK